MESSNPGEDAPEEEEGQGRQLPVHQGRQLLLPAPPELQLLRLHPRERRFPGVVDHHFQGQGPQGWKVPEGAAVPCQDPDQSGRTARILSQTDRSPNPIHRRTPVVLEGEEPEEDQLRFHAL